MLACVCQPADARLFSGPRSTTRSLEMAPRPRGRMVRVITRAPQKKSSKTKAAKENTIDQKLPEGVALTLGELRDMACRQQQQIDAQHQLLAAKEQRLRYLKDQEARHQRVAAENERLRRLRERVEAQELKLRKLRALRGQVDQNKQNNVSLTSDLDSIRALFNEKEKELSLAVAKVDELTRQLEDLRRGRPSRDQTPSAAALELDKLRRELMYRNKLNEQQNARLCQQREALTQRQEEMTNIDKRISELQDRLHRKRILNQQLANQITAASHKAQHQPLTRSSNGQHNQQHHNGLSNNNKPPATIRGNIAAVEPYKHVPQQQLQNQIPNEHLQVLEPPNKSSNNDQNQEYLSEFAASKSDPKYQTLPYNTKFTVNFVTPGKKDLENNNWQENDQKSTVNAQQHMTVHSTPLSVVNKSLATPLTAQNDQKKQLMNKIANGESLKNKHLQTRGQPVGQPASISSNHHHLQHKPISSVAPTSINKQLPTSIYQSSSTKIQPVQPQTLTGQQQLALSPPQSTSTPLGTPEVTKVDIEKPSTPKPALPPKPSIKPPPRQTPTIGIEDPWKEKEQPSEDLPLPSTPPIENIPAIKAKPLTIKKQALGEQPRLRSLNTGKMNGYHISINRRIEMPPAFLFPEMDSPDLLGHEASQSENTEQESTEPESPNEVPKDSPTEQTTPPNPDSTDSVIMRVKKGNLKQSGKANLSRRVSFDPLALLLDASLEGELELVKKTATQVPNPSAANDEGITALHNAICAGHLDIVKFLVEFGCDVNAQDSDGWTPLHCAASCNNVAMVRFLVEHGACIFATTLSDHETAAEKCEEDEEGFDGCSEYLYSVQEKLGILSGGAVYAVFDYAAQQPDELSFSAGQQLTVLRKGDESEREWWWARLGDNEGYIPRNLLGLCPRVVSKQVE